MTKEVLNKYNNLALEFKSLGTQINAEFNKLQNEINGLKINRANLEKKNENILKENQLLKNEIIYLKERLKEVEVEQISVINLDDTINEIFEKYRDKNMLVKTLSDLLNGSDGEVNYTALVRRIMKINHTRLNGEGVDYFLSLFQNINILRRINESYLIDLIKFIMSYSKRYEKYLLFLINQITNESINEIRDKENIRLLIFLRAYFGFEGEMKKEGYNLVEKGTNANIELKCLIQFIKDKKYEDVVFDFGSISSKYKHHANAKSLDGFLYLRRKITDSKDMSMFKVNEIVNKEKQVESKVDGGAYTVKINFDDVDSLSIQNNIVTCNKDKNTLIRKRVKLSVYKKTSSVKDRSVEVSVYHCKQCKDYIVNSELIRDIYKVINIKNSYIKFKNMDNLKEVSIINALGYNTNISTKARRGIINNIIIPTVGSKKLLHHLEFLVRFQKNNTKDFSNAIAIWTHDIAYIKTHYDIK